MKKVVLPASFLKCVSPEDRKKLKLGMTPEEFMAAGAVKNERDLQKQIVSYLRMKGIVVNVSRMDKRKTDVVGWPDLTFAIMPTFKLTIGPAFQYTIDEPTGIFPCAWEIKYGNGRISYEQDTMMLNLSTAPNFWRVRVIRSLDQAIEELREMGIK